MKITSLIENSRKDKSLVREHGLSLLIETKDKKILFDSGQSGNFTQNADKLGIDLKDIDLAILSHGHYDHGGGLQAFLDINKTAKVLVPRKAFGDYYHRHDKYIGLDPKLSNSDRLIFVDDFYEVDKNIVLKSCNDEKLKYPIETFDLFVKKEDKFIPEEFKHEHYLEITEGDKSVLFSGCSHKGILNIMNWFRPDVLIGGFHLMEVPLDEDGIKKLEATAKELMDYPTQYYTCHCTGRYQYSVLKEIMGDQLEYLGTGDSIEIN